MSVFLRLSAALVLLAMMLWASLQLSCKSWPSVKGEVLKGGWASESGSEEKRYGVYEAHYEYKVKGQLYSNSLISYNENSTSVKILNDEDQIIRQPRTGDTVTVYYFSFYPGISVLLPEVSPTLWVWAIISALIAASLIAWAKLIYHPLF
jgi:hypothetical protein